eukprot:COSAG01_NODE_46116_length_403_cov_0.631579_1_plen_62_part_10
MRHGLMIVDLDFALQKPPSTFQQEFCRIPVPIPPAAEFLFCRFAKIRRIRPFVGDSVIPCMP